MSTLIEIERAASQLSPAEQDELLQYLSDLRQIRPSVSPVRKNEEWVKQLETLAAAITKGPQTPAEQIVSESHEERV
jgi:hypothetical protein